MVRHRWISQDGKACLLASWFLSRDVAVHSGVVGASDPAPRCFKFRRKTRPGDSGGTTTADATVWQNPCSAAGGLCVVNAAKFLSTSVPRASVVPNNFTDSATNRCLLLGSYFFSVRAGV